METPLIEGLLAKATPGAATPGAAAPGARVLGFDTGFFVRLVEGDDRAAAAWTDVREGRAQGVVSCVTLFELDRLGLRTAVPPRTAQAFVQAIGVVCRVVWIGPDDGADLLARAARLGHGNGLAMADALILTSLLGAGARTVYTTDSLVGRYDGPTEVVVL